MTFNIPDKIDNWLFLQFLLFFLVGFMINVYTNGQATIVFLENHYGEAVPFKNFNFSLTESSSVIFETDYQYQVQYLKDYYHKTEWNSNFAKNLSLIFYWLVSPLINFIFAVFVFKKDEIW